MIRYRSSLLLLALAMLFVSGIPVAAESGDPAVFPWLDADRCTEPDPSSALEMPVLNGEAAIPQSGFILCTCKFCDENPEVICQISPTGYSIRCRDWFGSHC
jgi:hypothetical protein